MSRLRKVAATGSLLATSAGLLALAIDRFFIDWPLVAFASLVGVAGLGLSMKSLVLQIFSRATAWIVLAPTLAITVVMALKGTWPDPTAAGFMLGSGAALLLARPMLHSDEAKEAFAPVAFRKTLLAASTASSAAGIITGIAALETFTHHHPLAGIGLSALALSLLASAVGVVRMRAWGILLGGATSFLALLTALAMHDEAGFAIGLASLPGLLLTLVVVLARLGPSRTTQPVVATRVAADDFVRVRVANDAELDEELELDGPSAKAARA